MTSNPEDHNQAAEDAHKILNRIEHSGHPDQGGIAAAQVYATLALVREQQVANRLTAQMISITQAMYDESRMQ